MSHRGHSIFGGRRNPFTGTRRVRPVGFETSQEALDRDLEERLNLQPDQHRLSATADAPLRDRIRRAQEEGR